MQTIYDLNTGRQVFDVLETPDGSTVSTRFDVSGQQQWSQQSIAVSGNGQNILLTENYRDGDSAALAFNRQGQFVAAAGDWQEAASDGSFASIDFADVSGAAMNVDFGTASTAMDLDVSGEMTIAALEEMGIDGGDACLTPLQTVGIGTNGSLAGNGAFGGPGAAIGNLQNNASVQAAIQNGGFLQGVQDFFSSLFGGQPSATPQPSQTDPDIYSGFGSGDVVGGIKGGDFTPQLLGGPYF